MFQNSFQNGNYFQLYDPKLPQEKLKNLYKISNVNGNNKVFDKDLKTYVLQFNSSNSKITFPKEDKKDLYLIQQYLVFQVYFYHGMSWNLELVISDLNKTKRRIMLSPTNTKLEIKPFFVKNPFVNFKDGTWNNLAIDLYSFMEAFKGQTYRCLDNVTMSGHFKLRRIYTTNSMPQTDSEQHIESMQSINLLPKNFYFPPGLQQSSQLTRYTGETLNSQINLYEPTQPSTKNNSSYLKSTKNRLSTPKNETVKSQKTVQPRKNVALSGINQKEFLANTNGPQMLNRIRKNKYQQSSDSQSQITDNVNTPQSTQKNGVRSKKKLIKTQVMPPKSRTSVERRQKPKIQQKQKMKSKLNPWRTNAKKSQTSKIIPNNDDSDRGSSPNTTLFKSGQKNRFSDSTNKGFDRKSDHYSQSEYIQLSQKFSTLTDGKFFKSNQQSNNFQESNINNNNDKEVHEHDQIQENIQMETNSMYSNSNKKEDMEKPQQMIIESICDSLDRKSPKKEFQSIGRTSYYGFAERLMKNYMDEKERPFSPPMGQREQTEQEQYGGKDEKQVQLMYDPVLNCYYDHKTHTYYQLKN